MHVAAVEIELEKTIVWIFKDRRAGYIIQDIPAAPLRNGNRVQRRFTWLTSAISAKAPPPHANRVFVS